MKTNTTVGFWSVLTVVSAVALFAMAQERVSTDDLLDMLESVDTTAQTAVVSTDTSVPLPEDTEMGEAEEALASVDTEVTADTNAAPVEEEVVAESQEVQEDVAESEAVNEMGEEETSIVEDSLVEAAAVESPTNGVVDDLGMNAYDEETASAKDNLISVRLNKVGLEEAINLFAQLSGANIIVPDLTESAQISVTLKDVEWRPALQSILDCYNYELYQKVSGSNVYSVRRRPEGAPEPQVVETFTLHYATVPAAASLIRDLLPSDAKVSEFASRNMVVVKSTESSLGEIRSVLKTIDIVRQQVYIESKFMELSDDAQKDLGIDWKVLSGYGIGTDENGVSQTVIRNDADTKNKNKFTDANGNRYEDASGYENNGQRIPGSGIFTLEGITPAVEKASSLTTTKVLTSVLNADEFRLVLSALEQNKGVNIVSNPKVIVANGQKANISIIRKEPNLKQERQQALNDQPDTITYTLDPDLPFFDYGIKLDVIPSINTSSNITVKIEPSLTRKYADKQAGDNTYPIIDEKKVDTIFNLADGQTAAIGGLTEVSDGKEEHKVPVLGSIPYLGRLFSWKQTIHGQKETIIFVTVGLANTQDIEEDTGLPDDSELARRRVIMDENNRIVRNQKRKYFKANEIDKRNDTLKSLREEELMRQQERTNRLLQDMGQGQDSEE